MASDYSTQRPGDGPRPRRATQLVLAGLAGTVAAAAQDMGGRFLA